MIRFKNKAVGLIIEATTSSWPARGAGIAILRGRDGHRRKWLSSVVFRFSIMGLFGLVLHTLV